MINILAAPQRRHAIRLADTILETRPADPTFGGRFTKADVHAARAEMLLRAGQCLAEGDRLQRQSIEQAQAFIKLTNDFIAGHPLALGGEG